MIAGLMRRGGAVLGPLRAFPFAQGYKVGSTLTGGRVLGSGEVRKVTNLNDTGAGSLRVAIETPGPADVVFEVAGIIRVQSEWIINDAGGGVNQAITVWGETAPSPGITIAPGASFPSSGSMFMVRPNNMIFRHIRFRMTDGTHGSGAILTFHMSPASRIIWANCSFAYNEDEMTGCDSNNLDITYYRCIIGPGSGGACKAMLLGSSSPVTMRVALIQNYWPFTFDRTPNIKIGNHIALYNNYVYACGRFLQGTGCFQSFYAVVSAPEAGGGGGNQTYVSVRGNRYEANATVNAPQFEFDQSLGDAGTPDHSSYFDDNVGITRCVENPAVVTAVANESDLGMTLPEVATVLSSAGIKAYILARAGARPLDRDQVDIDNIAHANAGTGTINQGAPPVYSLGSGSTAFNTPANPFTQAPGEAAGWRVLDKYIYQNYTLAVEA